MTFQNKRLAGMVIGIALLLLIAFLAMRVTGAPNWSRFDFITAGVMLSFTALATELVLRMVKTLRYRIAIGAAILFGLVIVWIELAVGVFGTRFSGS